MYPAQTPLAETPTAEPQVSLPVPDVHPSTLKAHGHNPEGQRRRLADLRRRVGERVGAGRLPAGASGEPDQGPRQPPADGGRPAGPLPIPGSRPPGCWTRPPFSTDCGSKSPETPPVWPSGWTTRWSRKRPATSPRGRCASSRWRLRTHPPPEPGAACWWTTSIPLEGQRAGFHRPARAAHVLRFVLSLRQFLDYVSRARQLLRDLLSDARMCIWPGES